MPNVLWCSYFHTGNKMLKMYLCNVNLASLSTVLYVDSSKVAIPMRNVIPTSNFLTMVRQYLHDTTTICHINNSCLRLNIECMSLCHIIRFPTSVVYMYVLTVTAVIIIKSKFIELWFPAFGV